MKKKITLLSLCCMLLALSSPADAQQAGKIPRIGYLGDLSASSPSPAFMQGLRDLGYVEGKNIDVVFRTPEGKSERYSDLAAELVRLNVDIIVVGGNTAIRAAKKTTSTIPIVMTHVGDPVGLGLVASLARPGGNITGLSQMSPDLSGKRVELLKEILPKVKRVAFLWDPATRADAVITKQVQAAAPPRRRCDCNRRGARSSELAIAFATATKAPPDALFVPSHGPADTSREKRSLDFAAKNKIPTVDRAQAAVGAGRLMAYGPSRPDLSRRAALLSTKF